MALSVVGVKHDLQSPRKMTMAESIAPGNDACIQNPNIFWGLCNKQGEPNNHTPPEPNLRSTGLPTLRMPTAILNAD